MQNSCSYKAILIGNGTMGQRHRRLFEQDGVEFIGVADTFAEADSLFAKVVAGEICPDFAVVASPATTHDFFVKKVVELGLPALVEKPVMVSAADVAGCRDLALDRNAFIFVGHSERYNPAIEEFVGTDFFRELKRHFADDNPGQDESAPVTFKFVRTHGFSERNRDVPVTLDLMVHDMDLLHFFADRKKLSFRSLDCTEFTEDRVSASFDFGTAKAEFVADRRCARDCRTVEISMDGRSVLLDLGAYRNGNPAYALQKEHRAFLNCLNEFKKSKNEKNEWDWRVLFEDACSAVTMVSLVGEKFRGKDK